MGNNKHLIHKNSNLLVNNSPKLPTTNDIMFGELAVNYNAGNEVLSLKNSAGNIITLPNNKTVSGIASAYTEVLKQEVLKDEIVVAEGFDAVCLACGITNENDEILYVPHTDRKYLSGVTSLDSATVRLNDAIETIEGTIKNIPTTPFKYTESNNGSIVTISGGTIAQNTNEIALGKYNQTTTDQIFSIGIGEDAGNRENAISLNKTGELSVKTSVTAPSFYQTSDKTLKENIKPISDEDIEKIKNIELVEYNYKEDKTKRYGVIAQDVEENNLQNLVITDLNDKKTVDYISLLILKVKQLENEIKELKK